MNIYLCKLLNNYCDSKHKLERETKKQENGTQSQNPAIKISTK